MANNWAIVVGINQYKFLPQAPLKFAAADALAMRSFLCEEAGFKPNQVLLCGDGGEEFSRDATRSTLRDILLHDVQKAQKADNLWFFFSGHGIDDHLMPIDGNSRDVKDTAISIHFVTDCLRKCKTKNIVMILDMCRNESRDVGRKNVASIETEIRDLVKQRDGQQGIITLFSCSHGESSYEIADLKQGAFTYALLEGLRSHSILKDLARHLEKRVPELHQLSRKNRKQVPLLIPEPDWKLNDPILSHYATAVDVVQLKEMALDAECDGDFDRALQLWEQVNLLATKPDDRRRALNKVRDLIGRVKPIDHETVDYSKLQQLLKDKQWRKADGETHNLMNNIIGTASLVRKLKTYPQDTIEKIDRLWADASDEKFGFFAQARIWQQVNRDKSEFEIKVGWRLPNAAKAINQSKLKLNLEEAEVGHFPAFFKSWGGGGWSFTEHLLDRVSEFLDSIDVIFCTSKHFVEYQDLSNLLKKKQWKSADISTFEIMLKVTNREGKRWLDIDSLRHFPISDLQIIDKLWLTASNGKFGFSIQAKIWEEYGSSTEHDLNWKRFGQHIGWCNESKWNEYGETDFHDEKLPKGHLPGLGMCLWGIDGKLVSNENSIQMSPLFMRVRECEVEQ